MLVTRTPVSFVLLLALAGCGTDTVESTGPTAQERAPTVEENRAAIDSVRLYDSQGNLLEGDRTIAGLKLPRGLEERAELDRRHIFHANVPNDKLLAYLGPRLVTGEVERERSQVIFRNARGVELAAGDPRRMDVIVRTLGARRSYLEVRLAVIPPPTPASEMEQAAALEREYNSLE